IMEVFDRCTVIRKGQGIGTVEVKDSNPDELASLMVGREVNFKTEKKPANAKEVVLHIENLFVQDARKVDLVKGLNLDVRAGEIVGIAGVDGNGQSELIEAITGLTKSRSGKITLKEKDRKSTR